MREPESKIAVSLQAVIDQVADRFERELLDGAAPLIENFLSSQASELRPYLLRVLLGIELALRRNSDEQPAMGEYIQRFPEYRRIVESVFTPAAEVASTMDQTKDTEADYAQEEPLTVRLGRYVIARQLGKGGFGVVYLAHDPQLDRLVALKVPRRERFTTTEQVTEFIQEARNTAKLKHPHLVTIYDVQEENGLPFIVQEYIDGENLAEWTSEHKPTFERIVQVLVGVAEALGYAHRERLTHCDLKLANVLMDQQGRPHVADFGLAVHESSRLQRKGARFGTPPMMAPEQVRGEGHRLDGRTDIWALGVMMYQLLVSQRPFTAKDQAELFNEIETLDPRPLRQIDRAVPRELERICLKCLSKRRTERYSTTDDLIEDLQLWLSQVASTQVPQSSTASVSAEALPESDSSSKQPLKIIPKGLRSFDAEDTDFFLELLPGPRDREGLPESIRFWKNRIEERDPDKTFSVGLIYGPSGCGKSSLVKAGLLPRLSEQVLAVYVEATAEETELRILKQFRKHLPRLPDDVSLPAACAELRRLGAGRDRKVLVIIDQFEQWLHAHTDLAQTALVSSVRQCDGGRLQFILLVRDDFFASVNRLFRELEEPLLEGRNYALVDRFDRQHACKVLTAFGRAYGKLDEALSTSQEQFISQAVEELVEEDKVISVRLSLFADMMKTRPWTLKSLNDMGGASGVGVTFLDETFSGKAAPPTHREHQAAIRQVLKALLPESGTDIKGGMRSADALRQASGYGSDQRRFGELLRILDGELRIITPTEPEGIENGEVRSVKTGLQNSNFTIQTSFYQLTHDYLVPSLREWLTRKQRETRRGRAELKLEERFAVWNVNREHKQLPSSLEWLQIRWHSDRSKWTKPQRMMMLTAAKVRGIAWGSAIAAMLVIGLTVQYWVSKRDWSNKREQTRIAAESLQNNLGPSIPVNIRELKKLPESLVLEELAERFATDNTRHKLALAFALAAYGRVETEYLISRIDDISTVDTANFVDALSLQRETALAAINAEADKCLSESQWRRKAKLAVAALALGDADIASDMCQYDDRPDPVQRTLFIHEFPQWKWLLPDRPFDLSRLAQLMADSEDSGLRSGISLAVGSIPGQEIQDLNPAGLDSWRQLASRWFTEHPDTSTHSAVSWLLRRWQHPLPIVADQTQVRADRDWFVNSAGMTMLRIRPPLAVPEPEIPLEDPLDGYRGQLAELRDSEQEHLPTGVLETRAMAYFQTGDYAAALIDMESLLSDPDMSNLDRLPIYRILALSRLGRHDDAATAYETMRETLSKSLDRYVTIQLAASRGDSVAALELLGDASRNETLEDAELYDAACAAAQCAKSFTETDASTSQQFKKLAVELLAKAIGAGFSDGQHLSQDPDLLVLHREPEFASLVSEIYKPANELPLSKSEFWIASCEVTRGQFEAFMQDSNYDFEKPNDWRGVDSSSSPTSDHPVQMVSWYGSIMYCNWLSRQEGKSPVYRKTGKKKKRDYLVGESDEWELVPDTTGYRLLRGSEWEFACRAGSTSDCSSGSDEQFLVDYCQMYPSKLSAEVGQKLPNAWGLQDMHGNVWEWCDNALSNRGADCDIRGGGWNSVATMCQSAFSSMSYRTSRTNYFGFRVALCFPSGVSSPVKQGQLAEPSGGGTDGVAELRPEMP